MEWINASQIRSIAGALGPTAYVARAYRHLQEHAGHHPVWARQMPNGRWLFSADYIREDAATNTRTISVHEAARKLGVTRRTIQLWADTGIVPSAGGAGPGRRGATRRIVRDAFERMLPDLLKRLATPAAAGYRRKHGKPVPHVAAEPLPPDSTGHHQARRKTTPERTAPESETELEQKLRAAEESAIAATREAREAARRADAAETTERRFKSSMAKRVSELKLSLAQIRDSARQATIERRTAEKSRTEAYAKERTARAEANRLKRSLEARKQDQREEKVAALEAQLRAAKETRAKNSLMERDAEGIARKLVEDMFDERIKRPSAMILFEQMASARGIPPEVRKSVMKRVFG